MTEPVDSPRQQLREALGPIAQDAGHHALNIGGASSESFKMTMHAVSDRVADAVLDAILAALVEAGWGPTAAHGELDHARAVIARHECATAGHDLGVETDDHGTPLRVLCSRPCGQGPWVVDHSGSHGR